MKLTVSEARDQLARWLQALRRHGYRRSAEIVIKTFRPRFMWMCRFEALAGAICRPDGDRPGFVEIVGASAADSRIVELSPYIDRSDLNLLAKAQAVCCLMRIDGEIAGFTFMIRGPFYVREIGRVVHAGPDEYYGFRSYVSPGYRGRRIMAWIKHDFAKNFAKPGDRLWGLVQPTNHASIRSNVSCGFECKADVCFISMFGLRFTVVRDRHKKAIVGSPPLRQGGLSAQGNTAAVPVLTFKKQLNAEPLDVAPANLNRGFDTRKRANQE